MKYTSHYTNSMKHSPYYLEELEHQGWVQSEAYQAVTPAPRPLLLPQPVSPDLRGAMLL